MKKFHPSLFGSLNDMIGVLMRFVLFPVPVYTMAYDLKQILFILKYEFSFPIVLYFNLVFCWFWLSVENIFLSVLCIPQGWSCHEPGVPFYVADCVVQHTPYLMGWMDISMMGMCGPCAHMFKLSGLIFSLKACLLSSLSTWYTLTLKTPALYMLVIVWRYLIIFSMLLEVNFLLWGRWYWMTLYVG